MTLIVEKFDEILKAYSTLLNAEPLGLANSFMHSAHDNI